VENTAFIMCNDLHCVRVEIKVGPKSVGSRGCRVVALRWWYKCAKAPLVRSGAVVEQDRHRHLSKDARLRASAVCYFCGFMAALSDSFDALSMMRT
jgi:hypothetical protein